MKLADLVEAVAFAALAAAALAAAALAALGACFGGLGVREAGKRVIVNHFWQLKDVAGEFWMNDAAIMQQTQLAEFLWLVTLQSRKRGSHRLGSD